MFGFFFPFPPSFFSMKQLQANDPLVTVLNSLNTGKKENLFSYQFLFVGSKYRDTRYCNCTQRLQMALCYFWAFDLPTEDAWCFHTELPWGELCIKVQFQKSLVFSAARGKCWMINSLRLSGYQNICSQPTLPCACATW